MQLKYNQILYQRHVKTNKIAIKYKIYKITLETVLRILSSNINVYCLTCFYSFKYRIFMNKIIKLNYNNKTIFLNLSVALVVPKHVNEAHLIYLDLFFC